MRLLVDCIPYDGGKSGISVYVREVIRALAAEGHSLTLLVEPGVRIGDFPFVEAPSWTRRALWSMLWHLYLLPRKLRKWRDRYDGFVVTAANRRVCNSYPLPTTATVHDLANFHIPGKYSRLRMFYLAYVLPHYARKASRLVAVSKATAMDMERFWGTPMSDVTVLYNGLTPLVRPEAGRESWIATNGLSKGGYVLYVSRLEHPGKNHVALIEAFAALDRPDLKLVLAGSDWKDAEVVHEYAKSVSCADRIVFTGFLAAEDMEEAYRGAAIYVFPSRFEGFGLSLVEAMAEGVPCACSSNGSLGEIAADVAETFDPMSVPEMVSAMRRLLDESQAERDARIARGRKHAAMFSWKLHAQGLVKLLKDVHLEGVRLFDIPVSQMNQADTIQEIISMIRNPLKDRARFVATVNVDFVTNAVPLMGFRKNLELWDYLKKADLVTADGMPIVLLSKMKGGGLRDRVTGADMVPALAKRFAEEGMSMYVLGGEEPALTEALDRLRKENPSLRVAGTDSSLVDLDNELSNQAIVKRVNESGADCLFVALGNPKQELWMGRNASRLKVPVMIGIGGTFNFIAGKVRRAPLWMQRTGLEWIYRILQEPHRLWRRYAVGMVKFSILSIMELGRKYK